MSPVAVEMHGGIAVIIIDDQHNGNALTGSTTAGLIDGLSEAGKAGATAVVLTGSEGMFCAGGDLRVLEEWSGWEPLRRRDYLARGPHAIARAIDDSGLASVAAVNGYAGGAGMDLAMVCDIRLASPRARFCEAYVNIGVVPGDGGAWLLPRIVGMGRAMDLLLTGRTIAADEALAWGLVTEVVGADQLLSRAIETAERLGSRSPTARSLTRELVLGSGAETWGEHLERVGFVMAAVAGGDEHRQAVEVTSRQVLGRRA